MMSIVRDAGRVHNLSRLAVVSLVILRITVGWHFFKEGVAKLRNPNFSSRYFLQDAQGPWTTFFWSLMDDPLALDRLDEPQVEETWDAYFSSLQSRAKDDAGRRELEAAAAKWRSVLTDYFRGLSSELAEYRAQAGPLAASMQDDQAQSQFFVNQRTRSRLSELQQRRAPWLAELGRLEQLMQTEIEQLAGIPASNETVGLRRGEKNWIDHSVTVTTLAVGALLLVGLMVPLASLVGGAFLLMVMLTQPFWVASANLTYAYYQSVEFAALLVLAATCAGRYAGLDFFWSAAKK
jgi:uncharacterized membrane protein YphA (DoxX/SURF4 family)